MTTLANKKLAVLIDADNAPADIIDRLLEEIAKYGIASVKRIYGDWSHGLSKWKAALLPHAIIPVQQFAYTKGKTPPTWPWSSTRWITVQRQLRRLLHRIPAIPTSPAWPAACAKAG